MSEISNPLAGMRMPVIVAPMLINSGPELMIASARAGVAGVFPAMNPRTPDTLESWIDRIEEGLADTPEAARRWGVNLIVNSRNNELEGHLRTCVDRKAPLVVTSLGAAGDVVDAIHSYGGFVLHDVASRRHAEKAIEAGVDGIVLLCGGAGGHGGNLNPFAFAAEIREIYDGIIVLAGGISTGAGVLAAQAAGADYAYLGTRFIATEEARVEPEYRQMVIESFASDIAYTNQISGFYGYFLKKSIEANGIDLETAAVPDYVPASARLADKKQGVWKRIWAAGHGVGAIHAVTTTRAAVEQLQREYAEARARLGRVAARCDA